MFNLLIGVQMASWAIVVKRKIQSTCKRVRTSKKSNNNVGIINFTEVTIAKNGSYSINCWSIYFFSLRDTHFFSLISDTQVTNQIEKLKLLIEMSIKIYINICYLFFFYIYECTEMQQINKCNEFIMCSVQIFSAFSQSRFSQTIVWWLR